MQRRTDVLRTACAVAALLAAPALYAEEAPFLAGRFVSDGREVFAGVFMNDVRIDSLTLGSATFRTSDDELLEPLAVRISVDADGDGAFELLADEQIRAGTHPAALAIGTGLEADKFPTALDAMQGHSLAHMLYTDGSAPVQVDVLLVASLYDDRPDEDDAAPELIVLGSMNAHQVSAAAIIGGNVDAPILAGDPVPFADGAFPNATTGVDMIVRQTDHTQHIAMVGLDLSHDLGVEEGVQVLGYRVIISPGEPAIINVLGAGNIMQRALAQDFPLVPDIEDFLLGALFSGSLSGGGPVYRVPGVVEGTVFLPRVPLDFRGTPGSDGGLPPADGPDEPVIPAPAALPALLLFFARPRRARSRT